VFWTPQTHILSGGTVNNLCVQRFKITIPPPSKNDVGWSRRTGAQRCTEVLVDLTTREDHFLCERVAIPACSHVAQSSSAQVLCVTHTKRATRVSGCAQCSNTSSPYAALMQLQQAWIFSAPKHSGEIMQFVTALTQKIIEGEKAGMAWTDISIFYARLMRRVCQKSDGFLTFLHKYH
jgi:hypothetical protein